MVTMKKWKINTPDREITDNLVKATGLSPFICKILASRGITSRAEAELFFNSNELSDPYDILDMDKAVEAINEALEKGEKIAVYGDYDCDGITSTYMLFNYLESQGGEVCWYIPDRDEGYGLNKPAIDLLEKQGVSLIITVDNGISAFEEAKYISEKGIKLVITDHHQPPEELPEALAVVDPHRKGDNSDFKYLAGCGVVLKLIMAMENDVESVMMQYADIAAIGTVGDIVSLTGENRIIVRNGLEYMKHSDNDGVIRLLKQCGIDEGDEVNSTLLAFTLCPRINAAGRVSSPKIAMELLLTDNPSSAAAKASELSEMNNLRQQSETKILTEVEEQLRQNPDLLNKPVLIVSGEGWSHGIIGIISSRLLHKYGKPNIVITKEGDTARGSGRSTEGLSLYKLLDSCKDLLIRFGGHTKAAGLTLDTERIEDFTKAAYEYCEKEITEPAIETVYADAEILPSELNISNTRLLENLEPFGEGNHSPVFLLKDCLINSKKKLKEGKYVSFNFTFGGSEYRAIDFGRSYDAFPCSEGDRVDIMAALEINEYNDRRSISVRVKDIRLCGFNEARFLAAKTAYENYRCGKIDKRLIVRMIPTEEEMKKVFDIIRTSSCLSKAEFLADKAGINCCKFGIVTDVFEEFSLIEKDIPTDSIKILPTKTKADLSKSEILANLKNMA